jgi:hypothetical protein
MFLVVPDGIITNHIPVNHILQVKQGCSFMPADVSQVIRTSAPQGQGPGILVFLNIHLVKGVVVIVFNPETNGIYEFIVLYKFNITDGMYLLTTTDYFICAIVINKLEEM